MGDVTKGGFSPYFPGFQDRANTGGPDWNDQREQVRLENKRRLDEQAQKIIADDRAARESWDGVSDLGPVERSRLRGKLAAAARAAGVGVLEHEARACIKALFDAYGPYRSEWPRPALIALDAGVALLAGEGVTVATVDPDTGEIFAMHNLSDLPFRRIGEIIPLPVDRLLANPVGGRSAGSVGQTVARPLAGAVLAGERPAGRRLPAEVVKFSRPVAGSGRRL